MILLGIVAVCIPTSVGIVVDFVAAALLVACSITHLLYAKRFEFRQGVAWELLLTVVYAVIGIFLLSVPTLGIVALTLLLVIYLVVKGVLDCAQWFLTRTLPNSEWVLMEGLFSVVIATMIGISWPDSSGWAAGVIIGTGLILVGVRRIIMPWATKKVVGPE
jgi:uncharacterized membrane protein HdeD (DUF308 family)